MPTFGATLRRKNGKLLERSILGLVSLRRTTARSDRETLGDRPFCRCMDGLLLMWRNDGCKKGCRSIGIDGCNSEFSVGAFVTTVYY